MGTSPAAELTKTAEEKNIYITAPSSSLKLQRTPGHPDKDLT